MINENIRNILAISEVETLFKLIGDENIYLVGGCIRNALSNKAVKDIDFATILNPDKIINILDHNNIKFLDIGKDHGTITAIINNNKYEITTCRSDIETDGRHALVKYTDNIKEDSNRRDFTINAIYVNFSGQIFDFHNGIDDLNKNKVRFIGDLEKRIQEDYLRILRFFRFQCDYHEEKNGKEDLLLIQKNLDGLNKVSKERLWIELKNIIGHENSIQSLQDMQEIGIFSIIFKEVEVNHNYKKLNDILINLSLPNTLSCKLSSLLDNDQHRILDFIKENPISNIEKENLLGLSNINKNIVSYMSMREARAALYRLGKSNFINQVLCQWSKDSNEKTTINWRALVEVGASWVKPDFTIKATDVLNMGISEGPKLGEILTELEEWWIDNDFIEDQFSLIERLKAICFAQH
ncbi:CCA tRNA nucleotidyltransferase [Pelagibacterales bacterium]|nr:CCA tRNA nucleotidyltransferase [Pelagibacterales bacterium]